jgi:hypothetical protein
VRPTSQGIDRGACRRPPRIARINVKVATASANHTESGRIEARIGLRMMPTFPRSSLSFRTAGFPQYGWKAGFPSGAFPDRQRLKPAPGMRRPTSGLHPPFVRPRSHNGCSALRRAADSIAHRLGGSLLLRPRGPRSGPGYSVPVRHHLVGPIRPTRRHTAISPHGGLYAMPSLCGSAEATHEWFRAFAAHSVLTCRPL